MASYYIKTVYAPARFPKGISVVGFAGSAAKQAERFQDCAGFLLYETGRPKGVGNKAILARGVVNTPSATPTHRSWIVNNKDFSIGMPIRIEKSVEPQNGIPLSSVRLLVPRLRKHRMQARGGLIALEPDEFKTLSGALDKCI